ncbi:hypothetical protein [Mycoplasmopsis agassizii]|uniref:Apea-like HEPN domain-containing protein n=1 Tax=Mycoplasmopsis agassizii TaxID=33922 RepID=A0ABX4H6W6_9BACT|nr:hypothetical protein [Mycoplasmopsis agassizii]PAF55483.1 hypothetical protein CJF60_02260 [Mycoplasmopsis agassizii]SMC18977.1 hypothetical protein SAMN02745179_00818 [Mycoplasmopsis agassizii]
MKFFWENVTEIIVLKDNEFKGTKEDLLNKFNNKLAVLDRKISDPNSEPSLAYIIYGCIKYFYDLPTNFLGDGNASGIPSLEADHFANNIYRLYKAICYWSNKWGEKPVFTKKFNILRDIRTIIVHSGEIMNDIQTLGVGIHKNVQLGRIFTKEKNGMFSSCAFKNEASKMDYCIQIDEDKKSKPDFNNDTNKSSDPNCIFKKIEVNSISSFNRQVIYLNVEDTRQIVLEQINIFLSDNKVNKSSFKIKKIAPTEYVVKEDEIDFKRICNTINDNLNKEKRFIDEKQERSDCDIYGLEKIYQYAKSGLNFSKETRDLVRKEISQAIIKFWETYKKNNGNLDYSPVPSVETVFKKYIPKQILENYIYHEKLFIRISPGFNSNSDEYRTEVNFLYDFINIVQNVLEKKLNQNQDVDGVICDFYMTAVEKLIEKK